MSELPTGWRNLTPAKRPAKEMKIAESAMLAVAMDGKAAKAVEDPFVMPQIGPNVVPAHSGGQIAMDSAFSPDGISSLYQWASQGMFEEGVRFLGFPYLAQLAQRSEYRKPVEIIAEHATRKFIELTGGDDERNQELYAHMDKFSLKAVFREAAEMDGFFGRGHLFFDFGDASDDDELAAPLLVSSAKIERGSLTNIKSVEPLWCYPSGYESSNPLEKSFYNPPQWFVMGKIVHQSRFLTLIGREVPDMLKPAYAFGGLALTQMGKPYVDNWLQTRQNVNDMVNNFSTPVLASDMNAVLQGGCADSLIQRAQILAQFRDNRGVLLLNKETEEFLNVAAPLSGLDKLQAQAQEHMSSVFGIPLVVLLGVTPSGLNASSDGEMTAFYASINAYQERVFREPLRHALRILQLDLWGEIDESIDFIFPSLWDLDEKERSEVNERKARTDAIYVEAGVVSQDEVRERLREDDSADYSSVDLASPAPEMPDTEESGFFERDNLLSELDG